MGSATTVAGYLFAHRRLRGAAGGGAGKSGERRVPRHAAAGSSPGPAHHERHDGHDAGADAARQVGQDEASASRGPRIYRDRAEFAREARARLAARRRDSQGI
jgi:hypothetical protein